MMTKLLLSRKVPFGGCAETAAAHTRAAMHVRIMEEGILKDRRQRNAGMRSITVRRRAPPMHNHAGSLGAGCLSIFAPLCNVYTNPPKGGGSTAEHGIHLPPSVYPRCSWQAASRNLYLHEDAPALFEPPGLLGHPCKLGHLLWRGGPILELSYMYIS